MPGFFGFGEDDGFGGRGGFPGSRRDFDGSEFQTPGVEAPSTSSL
jgi:hypothetical protein